jgi:Ca2+:H+ antiporter
LGSIVEIILLAILLHRSSHHVDASLAKDAHFLVPVIRDAIIGSILANLLLCLGVCFFVGGLRREVQTFDSAISEVGSGLLLVAGFGLAITRAFYIGVSSQFSQTDADSLRTEDLILHISRATAILLLIAFCIYVFFQMRSHHGLYDTILEADEEKDEDGHKDKAKLKLTLTECILALAIALTLVSMHAFFLVMEIEPIIEETHGGVSETFMGLILVPLIEKLSEHLTAIDEAWDNQMNFALVHVLGSSLQTALLNTSIIVLAAWGIGTDMDLNFSTFQIVLLILTILVVGNFIRDRESNYLEGALMVITYLIITVAAFYFPNVENTSLGAESEGGEGGGAEAAARMAKMMFRA